jgi:hypothetical protein
MEALGTEKPLPLGHRRGGIRLVIGLDRDGDVAKRAPTIEKAMVGPWGLEPQTSTVSIAQWIIQELSTTTIPRSI